VVTVPNERFHERHDRVEVGDGTSAESEQENVALDLRVDLRVYPFPVSDGLLIADVARRTGFSQATLRYYEEIGLLPAPPRSGGGYRLYDDAALSRLAFITRAKQLGCTLDEIADLTRAWEGGRCGPVQDRLQAAVSEKLSDARHRIGELLALTAELQQAAAALEQHRPDGPCDERCGCTTTPGSAVTPVALGAKPVVAQDVPIACSLDATAMPTRLADWRRLLQHVSQRSAVDGGIRLEFVADVPVDDVLHLATAEQDCCRFFAFAVTIDNRGIGLEVRAPADARMLVDAVFGAGA